jgi:putative ubiquitin-RnfH superfamily antitoxin RatB of RatAB toxin-antitoxin module
MDNAELIWVEVAYAKPEEQALVRLSINLGCTVEQAIVQSKLCSRFPEIDLVINKVGIFSKPCKLDKVLAEGDRVEIYRPLLADPKAIRKQRAAEGKVMKKGGGAEIPKV